MTPRTEPHNIHDISANRDRAGELTVSVVIPTYNRSTILSRTLESLAVQDPDSPRFDVHVADDGSEEDIRAVVESVNGLDAHYHRRERDRFGAGQARNLAANAASGDIVVFLDSDCLVEPNFVTGHASWHVGGGRTVLIGGRTHAVMGSDDELADYRKRLRRRTAGLQHGSEIFRSFVTANVSLPLSLFHEVGGFDERFHRWGGEDTELGWRLWNAGAIFLDDESVSVTHQVEEDPSGGAEGRRRAHEMNMGLISSLIPHRFYRKEPLDTIAAVPKVSVLLHDVPAGSSREIWDELLRQPRSDFDLIVVADDDDEEPLAGASAGDPRLSFVGTLEEAVAGARGEYICFLNGHAAPSRSLLTELVRRMDRQPMKVTATVGYVLPDAAGGAVRSSNGARDVDRAWRADMPLCWLIRTREVVKLRDAGHSIDQLWAASQEWDLNIHWTSAAVRLPGAGRTDRPRAFTHSSVRRQELAIDVLTRKRSMMEATTAYLRTRSGDPDEDVSGPMEPAPSGDRDQRPKARYIGWSGHHNLGDEVMLEAIRGLLSWADVETTGDPGQLLILGGGTLINRSSYLKQVTERDTPRVERVVIGTGVASPEYWGEVEDPRRWVQWLSTCAYVGVRGPYSYERLRLWGFEGDAEMSGDSALLVERPPVERMPGRVVVAPAWTKGRLWGGSDETVIKALGAAVDGWRADGREVIALSSSPDDDGQLLQMSLKVGNSLLPFVQGYLDRDRALETIASAEVVVGERLHACVLAAAFGTPFVPIEYRPKLRDFAASVGVEHLVIRSDELSDGLLSERVADAVAAGTGEILENVARYRQRLEVAGQRIQRAVTA
ncbi:MAG TPA: glycosyltransferase [Acidimicrobiia bacterium]|nr:glycosyltransferase [Acidimicrobiia bacterium]